MVQAGRLKRLRQKQAARAEETLNDAYWKKDRILAILLKHPEGATLESLRTKMEHAGYQVGPKEATRLLKELVDKTSIKTVDRDGVTWWKIR